MRWPVALAVAAALGVCLASLAYGSARDHSLDGRLAHRMQELGFTGRVESTLTTRLGRPSIRNWPTPADCSGSTR